MEYARKLEEVNYKRITFVMEGIRDVRAQDSEKLAQVIKEKMNQQIAEWKNQEEEDWMKQNGKVTPTPHVAQTLSKEEPSASNFDFQTKPPETWSTEDVTNWLFHMGFRDLVSVFRGT